MAFAMETRGRRAGHAVRQLQPSAKRRLWVRVDDGDQVAGFRRGREVRVAAHGCRVGDWVWA